MNRISKSMFTLLGGIVTGIILLGIIGWVRCVVKLVKQDFDTPYKAELIYGIGTFTGAGAIIGWINIK